MIPPEHRPFARAVAHGAFQQHNRGCRTAGTEVRGPIDWRRVVATVDSVDELTRGLLPWPWMIPTRSHHAHRAPRQRTAAFGPWVSAARPVGARLCRWRSGNRPGRGT